MRLINQFFTLTFIFTLLFSCSGEKRKFIPDNSYYYSLNELSTEQFKKSYASFRTRMTNKKTALKNKYDAGEKTKSIENARKYLDRALKDSMFHFWYDTEWDFSGTTESPREGNIACGYFVTTTLKHAGFELNRVQLAQQAASIIINTLCDPNSIKIFSNGNLKGFERHVGQSKSGLYILGLDNHVGFISKEDTVGYMIHSSGVRPYKVTKEKISECSPIQNSNFFMIGDLLGNEVILKKWILGEKIAMKE